MEQVEVEAQAQPQPRVKVQNMVFTCFLSTPLNLLDIASRLRDRGAGFNPKKFAAVITRMKKTEEERPASLSYPNFPESSPLKIRNFDNNSVRGNDDNFRDMILAESFHPVQFHAYPCTEPPPQSQRFYKDPKIAILLFRTGKVVCTGGKTEAHAIYMVKNLAHALKNMGYSNIKVKKFHIKNLVATSQVPYNIDREKIAARYPSFCVYEPDIFPGVIMRYPGLEPRTALVFSSGKINITGAKSEEEANTALSTILPLISNFMIKFEDGDGGDFSNINIPPPPTTPSYQKSVGDAQGHTLPSVKRSVDDFLKSIVGSSNLGDGDDDEDEYDDEDEDEEEDEESKKSDVWDAGDKFSGKRKRKEKTDRKKRKKEEKDIAPHEILTFDDPCDAVKAAFEDLSRGNDKEESPAKREKFEEVKKLIENSGFSESLATEWTRMRSPPGYPNTAGWNIEEAFLRIWKEKILPEIERSQLRNSIVGDFYLEEQRGRLFDYVSSAALSR